MKDFAVCIAALTLVAADPAFAWDGTETETGNNVEIEKGQLVRTGRDIEVYDTTTGEYRNMSVEDINRSGSTVEIEVYDYNTVEYRTLEMED